MAERLLPSAVLIALRPGARGWEVACWHQRAGQRLRGDLWCLPDLQAPPGAPALPCGGWTTPPFAPARPEVRAFLTCEPGAGPQAPPGVDRVEWLAPGELLARWRADQALLEPWTKAALEALDGLASGAAPEAARAVLQAALSPPGGEWPGVELVPGLRVVPLHTPTLPPATHTNCFLVGDGSELVVIDAASPWPEEQARLEAVLLSLFAEGRRVRELLLTHHHPDHCGGTAALAARLGVPVAAHARTRELLRGRVEVGREVQDGEAIELPADRPGARPRRLRARLLEGHADGHLVFHEEVTNQVIAGDMVAGTGTILIDPPEGKMALYLRSLERLGGLGAAQLYPAHGPPIGDPARLAQDYVTHRLMREAKVLRAVEQGAGPIPELVPRAYDDTPPGLWPLAARSMLAHLEKLLGEGRVARAGEVWSRGA